MVLLKGVDERGFIFYTNYDSRKGRELVSCYLHVGHISDYYHSPYLLHFFLSLSLCLFQTENPRASLMFYWDVVKRQVSASILFYFFAFSFASFSSTQIRIEGEVERLPAQESDRYFSSRPIDSQLSAAASNQSCELKDRQVRNSLISLNLATSWLSTEVK